MHFVPEKRRSFHVLSHVEGGQNPGRLRTLPGDSGGPGAAQRLPHPHPGPAHSPGRDNHCFLLESAADQEGWGRWTFLGFEPELEITAKDGVVQLRDGERTSSRIQHPGEALRQILSEHKSPKIPGQPPFTGGLVGYFSYDYMKYAEPTLRLTGEDQEKFKDMDLMLFRSVIAFDNFRQKIILITNADALRPG